MTKITIANRFCGPTSSGNGGYVCGLLARELAGELNGDAVVRLEAPPPLDTALEIQKLEETIQLVQDDKVLATARTTDLRMNVPDAIPFSEAVEAGARFIGFESHPYPCCFVCGPDRKSGDGLRVFAGKTDQAELLAAPWIPDASLTNADGFVNSEFLWAALDCPGAFTFRPPEGWTMLLGEFAAHIDKSVVAGEECVVLAWDLGSEGRKHFTGTALYNGEGENIAYAHGTWITFPVR